MKLNSNNWHRYVIFAGAALAASYFFFLVQDVVVTFVLGGIMSYLLYHPVKFMEKHGIKRVYAILLLYVIIVGLFSLVLYWGVPRLVNEVGHLLEMYPQIEERAVEIAEEIDGVSKPVQIDRLIHTNINKIESAIFNGLQNFITGIYSFMSKIFTLILAPILAFYILTDWEKLREGILNLFSPGFRREVQALTADVDRVLIDGIKGSLLIAVIVGALVGLSALILGVRFPLVIGLLAGITNLIPYFGPFIGGIPAVIIAYSDSFQLAVYQTLAILIVQQIESNMVTPRILGGKLGMHPLFIIFALLAGGSLYGIWGILFAVPVAAIIKVTISWIYLRFAA